MLLKYFLTSILISLLIVMPIQLVEADTSLEESQMTTIQAKQLDQRALLLRNYLARFNSPLQYHAQDFIDAADTYQMDWKLVPAIAGVESTFGKFIPGGFNGWGWGVYGTQAIYFTSWRDGIFMVSKGLKENYINKGLTNPYSMNKVYAASPAWGWKVDFFLKDIDKFSRNYSLKNKQAVSNINIRDKSAGTSAQLKLAEAN